MFGKKSRQVTRANPDPIGKLIVTAPNLKTMELPLVAGSDVGQLGMVGRMGAAVSYLVFGRGTAAASAAATPAAAPAGAKATPAAATTAIK
mgnify:CR=1 FL=1